VSVPAPLLVRAWAVAAWEMAPVTVVLAAPVKISVAVAPVPPPATLARVSEPPPMMLLLIVWDPAAAVGVVRAPALRLTPLAPVKFNAHVTEVDVPMLMPLRFAPKP